MLMQIQTGIITVSDRASRGLYDDRYVERLPDGKLVRLEGYDFGIHYLAPERCVQAVRQFVAERTH